MKKQDAFLARSQQAVATSAGPMDFPILYRDIGGVTALFRVDTDRVERQLAGTDLVPAPYLVGGKSVVGVAFFTYRDCTIQSYNEAALAVTAIPSSRAGYLRPLELLDFFRPMNRRAIGTYIMQLPVTTEQARAGGVEVYGYPKFVADIDFSLAGTAFTGVTRERETGLEIVRLEGRGRFGVSVPGGDVLTWSHLNGQRLKTHIEMEQTLKVFPGKGFRLTVGPSQHRMAQQLRALGLEGATPFMVLCGDAYRSVLPLGQPDF